MINHSATSDICDKQAINALAAADPALGPTKDNVAVIAPMFANEKDQGTAYPYEESNALAWTGAEWAYGRNNIYPAYSTNTSSFHVLDEIVAYYQDQSPRRGDRRWLRRGRPAPGKARCHVRPLILSYGFRGGGLSRVDAGLAATLRRRRGFLGHPR